LSRGDIIFEDDQRAHAPVALIKRPIESRKSLPL
jgi:hypothetical protein